MSDIGKLAQDIAGVGGKIDLATAETQNAAQETAEVAEEAGAIGAEGLAQRLGEVKNQLDALAATLQNASARATGIQAFTLSVGKGAATSSFSSVASSDPAGIPAPSPKKRRSARGKGRERLAALTEQSGDVGDLVSYAEKTAKGLADSFKGPPKPPEVTGAGTRTPDSPPIASPAALTGPDVPAAASGFAVLGLAAFGLKYAVKRTIRGIRAEEQFPEEIPPPPPTRYPWEDEPRPDDRP